MILDGKIVAQNIYNDLKEKVSKLLKKPKLSIILIGNNPNSLRYVGQKQKWAEFIGYDFELLHFEENTTEQQIINEINKLNQDNSVNGFMVQLPLPKHINEKNVLNAINYKKDIDGFHPINHGKIVVGDETGFPSCTPAGILELMNFYKINISGKNIVILGRSNIVGKPLSNMLINAGATVTVCNSKTQNLEFFTKNADIIITAIGKPHFLTLDKIGENSIIIDVGFSVIDGKIFGDCDFENISKMGNSITPVPGGVGPLTVSILMKNVLKAFLNQNTL